MNEARSCRSPGTEYVAHSQFSNTTTSNTVNTETHKKSGGWLNILNFV